MFPFTSTPELARQAAAACHYPPAGRRGSGAGLARFTWPDAAMRVLRFRGRERHRDRHHRRGARSGAHRRDRRHAGRRRALHRHQRSFVLARPARRPGPSASCRKPSPRWSTPAKSTASFWAGPRARPSKVAAVSRTGLPALPGAHRDRLPSAGAGRIRPLPIVAGALEWETATRAITDRRSPRYKWYVVAMLWWIAFFNYADRQAIFSVFPLLEKEFDLSPCNWACSVRRSPWVYGIGRAVRGMVVDRVRRKSAILGGLHAWSVICMATALSRNFTALLLFRGAEGWERRSTFPRRMSLLSDYHGSRHAFARPGLSPDQRLHRNHRGRLFRRR